MDAYNILWSDLAALKRRWPRYLVTTLISPLLYLVAFGWGLGRGISLNGTSYLQFVIPGIIALTAMTTSFNGAGTRLNVDRLYYKSFDECIMAPIGLTSLLMGKSMIGIVRGLISSVAFLVVAMIIAPEFTSLCRSWPGWSSPVPPSQCWECLQPCWQSPRGYGTFSSVILLPMTFLGGTFFHYPRSGGLKYALYILPLTHSSLFLRAAALDQPLPWDRS
jgi:hypothetical protein